jgi:hypothetical protein
MVESSIFINFFLSIALALSVHAQTAPPPTISSATSITSESAYASSSSSQMAWWNKTWDVVVVGSGPAGIIGKFPSVFFLSCLFCIVSHFSPLVRFTRVTVVFILLTVLGSCLEVCCILFQYVCSPHGGRRPILRVCWWCRSSGLVEWGEHFSRRLSRALQFHFRQLTTFHSVSTLQRSYQRVWRLLCGWGNSCECWPLHCSSR